MHVESASLYTLVVLLIYDKTIERLMFHCVYSGIACDIMVYDAFL